LQVSEGITLAAGMDPAAEIKALQARFEGWTKDFKVGVRWLLSIDGHLL
jgi:hypothetical protein